MAGSMARLVWLALVCSLCACAHGATVLLLDSPKNLYLNQRQDVALDGSLLGAVITSLTALRPVEPITQEAALQVADIVKSTPFNIPHALVSINIVGMNAGAETLKQLSGDRHTQSHVIGDGLGMSSAEVVMQTMTLIAQQNLDVNFQVLDHLSVQGCLDDCVEGLLLDLAPTFSAKYTPGKAQPALHGQLVFDSAILDLSNNADRLWAVELVTLHHAAHRAIEAASGAAQRDITVLDATLVGPQALARAHAGQPEVVAAAQEALLTVLRQIFSMADETFDGKAVFQVGLLGSVAPAQRGPGLAPLVQLKEAARRRLAADDTSGLLGDATPEDIAGAKRFSAKAAGYGSFLLLLYFSFGAIYCMCNMNFKQDTLLYARTKAD